MRCIDLNEAASRLNVHRDTIKTYCEEGLIPSYKLKRIYRILETDFEKFLEGRKVAKGGNQ